MLEYGLRKAWAVRCRFRSRLSKRNLGKIAYSIAILEHFAKTSDILEGKREGRVNALVMLPLYGSFRSDAWNSRGGESDCIAKISSAGFEPMHVAAAAHHSRRCCS